MAKVSALAASGCEEVELLMTVDILRRGGVTVEIVSTTGERVVTCSHKSAIVTDRLLEECDFSDSDVLMLPGGVPGVTNLEGNAAVCEAVKQQLHEGRRVAAICAAPSLLGHLGLLKGKRFTCYPGYEGELETTESTQWTGERTVTDGLITTGRGLGCAMDFGLELLRVLQGEECAEEVKRRIQYPENF